MKTTISKITLFTALFIACVFSVIILWNMQSIFTKFSRENKEGLRTFYIDQQKKLIKNEIERLVQRISVTKATVIKAAGENLRDQVRSAENFIQTAYMTHEGEEYKTQISNMISSFNWSDKSGYFYIISGNGIVRHHGARPELVGKNIYALEDKFPELIDFLDEAKTKGAAMGQYTFYKPGKGDEPHKKTGVCRIQHGI